MDYPKNTPSVGLVNGQFVDENPVAGTPGSLIPATWGNAVTQEILNVIKAAGIVPKEEVSTQLLEAIQSFAAHDFKNSVRAATTGTIALSGLQNIDGVQLAVADRVLVKDQANAAQNGVYVAATGSWSRAVDAAQDYQVTTSFIVATDEGLVNKSRLWQLTTPGPIKVGATGLTFEMLAGYTGVAPGEYRKVMVNARGQVTSGTNPVTLDGYGIADAYTKVAANNAFVKQGGGTGQLGNAVSIGWDGKNILIQVDATSFGALWCAANFDPNSKANVADVYSKTAVNGLLDGKIASDACSVAGFAGGSSATPYMRNRNTNEVITLARTATTLGGYGITDAPTTAQVNSQVDARVLRDSITYAGFASNDATLPYFRRVSDNAVYFLQPRLGFTPVRQGGGNFQSTNTVMIGWAADGTSLRAQVDATDLGSIWTDGIANAKAVFAQSTTGAGAVGSYALLVVGGGGGVGASELAAGVNCRFTATDGSPWGVAPAGTWRLMGHIRNADGQSPDSTTLCLRVS
ncbi:phage tail protein [Pseudomonas sp. NPDC096950]|uniref:phage tail protein n=1 Tax=Pseudomonas sp. NPDC096950 TaxID=3364485 RepID=UPI00383A63C5